MRSVSVLALRSAAGRAAWSGSRRGLCTANTAAGDAEREKIAALVQQEVRSLLHAEWEARAKAERESVAALVQRAVRDRLREEEQLRAEGERRAYRLRLEQEQASSSGSGLWGSADPWMKGFASAMAYCLMVAAYSHLCTWKS